MIHIILLMHTAEGVFPSAWDHWPARLRWWMTRLNATLRIPLPLSPLPPPRWLLSKGVLFLEHSNHLPENVHRRCPFVWVVKEC